jgi:predicted glutamine amidotransferase
VCRLFGFRSSVPSQPHRSLMDAENALAAQSLRHPDGWGIGWFADGDA